MNKVFSFHRPYPFIPTKAVGGKGNSDNDAEAFITAANLINSNQKSAINRLTLDLKAAGVWIKLNAIYPMVGGNAIAHAVNLKSPGTYDLSWYGSLTHSATGVQFDGSTAYASTNTGVSVDTGNFSFGVFRRAGILPLYTGACDMMLVPRIYMGAYDYGAPGSYFAFNNPGSDRAYTPSSLLGFHNLSKVGEDIIGYHNGNSVVTFGNSTDEIENDVLELGRYNQGSSGTDYSPFEYSFAFYGFNLTPNEVGLLTAAIQTFQTTLGRNI